MDVERREKILGRVTRGGESEYGVGVGVTLEVGSAWVKPLVKIDRMDVERREKILGWVTRWGESDGVVGVGVTLEVGSAWVKPFKMA